MEGRLGQQRQQQLKSTAFFSATDDDQNGAGVRRLPSPRRTLNGVVGKAPAELVGTWGVRRHRL